MEPGARSQASTAVIEYDKENQVWLYDESTAPNVDRRSGADRFNDWFREFKRKADRDWLMRHPLR